MQKNQKSSKLFPEKAEIQKVIEKYLNSSTVFNSIPKKRKFNENKADNIFNNIKYINNKC